MKTTHHNNVIFFFKFFYIGKVDILKEFKIKLIANEENKLKRLSMFLTTPILLREEMRFSLSEDGRI